MRPVPWELFPKSGRAASAGVPDSGEYFSRLLRSGVVWGSEIAGDAKLSGEIGRNVWRLSALSALANGISATVLEGRVWLTHGRSTHARANSLRLGSFGLQPSNCCDISHTYDLCAITSEQRPPFFTPGTKRPYAAITH